MKVIIIILITIFLVNYFLYWIVFFKTERKKSKSWDRYTQIYLILWRAPVILIPIITSSLFSPVFGTVSYFQELWTWFLLLGIVLIILGVKFGRSAFKINSIRGLAKGKYRLITDGVYEIMRHPMDTSWAVIFLGLALIFDSLISLIITPFFVLLLEFECFMEEKYLLIPQFGDKYEKYKEKTPNRLFPTPYNFLLIIIAIFIVYVGVINFYIYLTLIFNFFFSFI